MVSSWLDVLPMYRAFESLSVNEKIAVIICHKVDISCRERVAWQEMGQISVNGRKPLTWWCESQLRAWRSPRLERFCTLRQYSYLLCWRGLYWIALKKTDDVNNIEAKQGVQKWSRGHFRENWEGFAAIVWDTSKGSVVGSFRLINIDYWWCEELSMRSMNGGVAWNFSTASAWKDSRWPEPSGRNLHISSFSE